MVVLHLLETRIGLELLDLSLYLLTVHQNLLADGLHAADFPVRHAPPALHAIHFVDIQQVESFPHLPQQSGQHCFVLDGVEGAGGVDDESTALELIDGLHEDGQLQRVQRNAIAGVPLGPLDGQLAGGPVAGAGHITEDLVEEELLLDVVDLCGVELGQKLARVVDHGHSRSARSVYLMDEHLCTTVVCIICDHAALLEALLAAVEHLEQLRGLGAGSSAHIEDDIGRLDVEEQWGQHGNQLLTSDESCVEGLLQVLVQVVEHLALLEDLLGGVDLVQHVAGVPGQDLDPGCLLGLVLLLLMELLRLVLVEHGGEEVGVLDLLAEGVKVGTAGVDAEDHRQLLLHGSPEELELLLGQFELQLVVVAEESVILRYGGAAPLVLDLFVPVRVGLELASAFAHIVGTYKRNLNLTHHISYHWLPLPPCSISSGCTCSTDSMSMELMELREEVPESFSSSKSQKRDSFFSSMRSRWELLLRLRLFLLEEMEKRGLKVSLILKKVNSLFSLFRTSSPSFSLGLSIRLLLLIDSWLDRSSSMFRSGLSKSGRFGCCRVSDFRFLPISFFFIGNIFSLGFGKPSKKLDSSIVDLLRSEAFEDDFSLSSTTSSISSFSYIIYQDCSCSALVAQKWKCPVCQLSLSSSSSLLESASQKSICRSFSTQNWEGLATLEIRLSMGVDSITMSSQHERSPPASLLVLLILISSVISSLCVFSFSELMEEYSVRNLLPKVLELKQLSPGGCLLGGRMTMLTQRSLREALEDSLSLSQMDNYGLVRLLWMGILLPFLCLVLSLSLELGERFLSLRLRRQSEESCLIISGSVWIMAGLSKLSLSLEVSSMFWYSLLFSSMRLLLLKVSGMRHFSSEGSPSRSPLMTRVRMAWQRSARNLSSASPTQLRFRWQSTQQALKQSSLAMLSSFIIFLRMQPAVSNLEWAMLSRKTSNLRISRPSSNSLSWLAFSSRKDCVNFSSSLCCELTDSFNRYSLSVFTLIQNFVKGAMITLLPLRHSGMYMWKEVSSLPSTLIRMSLGSHSAPSWQSSQVRNSTLQTKLFLFLLRKVLRLSGSQAVEFLRRRRVRPCRVSLLYLMKLVLLKASSSRNSSTWQLVWCSFRSWQRNSAQMLFTSSSNCPCSITSPITACDNSQMSAEQSPSSLSSTACSILRLLLRNSSSEQSCVLSCGKRQSCSQFPRGLLVKQRRMKLQIWSRVQYSVEKRNMASLSLLQRMVFFSFIFAKKSLRVLPMQLTLLLQQLKFTDSSSPELHKSTSSTSSATHFSRSQPSSRLSCERSDDNLL